MKEITEPLIKTTRLNNRATPTTNLEVPSYICYSLWIKKKMRSMGTVGTLWYLKSTLKMSAFAFAVSDSVPGVPVRLCDQ